MRILHIPHDYYPFRGGGEHLCKKISEILVGRGHEVQVVTVNTDYLGYRSFGRKQICVTEEVVNGVKVKRLPYGGVLYKAGYLISKVPKVGFVASWILECIQKDFARQVHKQITKFSPDVIMSLPYSLFNTQCVLLSRKLKKIPLVMVPLIHEYDAKAWPDNSVKELLEQADALIALTNVEANSFINKYKLDKERVFVSGLGVDLPEVEIPQNKQTKTVLFLGRKLIYKKGISDLVVAMQIVLSGINDARLILAGSKTDDACKIDELLANLPEWQRKQIFLYDDIEEEEKSRLLSEAACLVLHSKEETFGLVLLEAWAHKVPIITLDLPIFKEIVSDGIDGMLISPDNPLELARAITKMITNSPMRISMGEAGYMKISSKYKWDCVVDKFLEAYRFASRGVGEFV